MRFKVWLEEIEKNHTWWSHFFLGIWDLSFKDGLGKNLQGFDTDKLIHTSEFQNLSPQQQNSIVNHINSGNGTVGDLVDIATGMSQIGTF